VLGEPQLQGKVRQFLTQVRSCTDEAVHKTNFENIYPPLNLSNGEAALEVRRSN
jgi:hypothetical protein